MARIFITGSSDGLGSLAAQRLIKDGHKVVLHARNAQRAKDATNASPGAETVLTGDLSSLQETKKLAEEVNKIGPFDAVIHNAGLYQGGFRKTAEGLPSLIAVNTIAPYALTCLINPRPKRLVFVSSGLHNGGESSLRDITWAQRGEKSWSASQAYADSKLHNVMFGKAFARLWPDVCSTSLDPGWIATKMGGSGASGDPNAAMATYSLLAEAKDASNISGKYFVPGAKEGNPKAVANDEKAQEKLLKVCQEVTGIQIPSA